MNLPEAPRDSMASDSDGMPVGGEGARWCRLSLLLPPPQSPTSCACFIMDENQSGCDTMPGIGPLELSSLDDVPCSHTSLNEACPSVAHAPLVRPLQDSVMLTKLVRSVVQHDWHSPISSCNGQ